MLMSSWLRSVQAQINRRLSSHFGGTARRTGRHFNRSIPCFETLEPRLLPATLLSINTAGTNSGGDSSGDTNFFTLPILSDDGRYVAFYSKAEDISPEGGVGNPTQRSIHVRDRQTNTTDLIQSNQESPEATADVTMSADGRFVAFLATTRLSNMRGAGGIFLNDRLNNTITLISNNNSGGANEGASEKPALSPDGRYVAFISREAFDEPMDNSGDFLGNSVRNQSANLYVHDTQTGLSRLVNATPSGNGGDNGSVAARYFFNRDSTKILFNSASSDLVANDTNGVVDVFLRDLATNTTTLISVNAAGTGSANVGGSLLGISADGSRVLFLSTSNNLVSGMPADGAGDIFLRDLTTNTTTLVSRNTAGTDSEGLNGTITPDGRYVLFESSESLVPGAPLGGSVYRKDLQTGELLLVNVQPDGTPSTKPARIATSGVTAAPLGQTISADGRFVVFVSASDDLVPNFVDGNVGPFSAVFVRDMLGGVTTLMSDSISSPTTSGNDQAFFAAISTDGKVVAFQSTASDLTANDTNGLLDVFANTVPTPGQPGQFQFDAETVDVNESDGTVTLTVTRTGGTYGIVRVNFATANSGATAGSDYTETTGTLTFLNGETSKTITVPIQEETTFEANETFTVTLSNPTATATLGTAVSTTVSITNDDEPPTVTLEMSSATLSEAGATSTVTARLSAAAGVDVTVGLNFGGTASESDFMRSSSQIVIPAGSTTGSITLTALNDTLGEANESIVVEIASVTNGTESGTQETSSMIVSDDTEISVAVSPGSVAEDGTPNLIYTFTRSGVTTGATTVRFSVAGTAALTSDYSQTGATSFSATTGTLAFAAEQTTKTLTINPTTDATIEANETVILAVTPAATYSVGTSNSATGIITNDDLPKITLTASPASAAENGIANAAYKFTRTGPTTSELTVTFTVGGTATIDNDFTTLGATTFTETSGSVTFGVGQATKTLSIDPTGDATVEANETIVLGLTTGDGYTIGTQTPVTTTITNDDAEISVAVSPGRVTEDGSPNLIYTFTRAGSTAGSLTVNFSVDGSANRANDYAPSGSTTFTATTGTVSFSSGQTTKVVTINPTADTVIESDETVILTLAPAATYLIGSANSATGTIANDDPRVTIAVSPASVIENGTANATYTFKRTGPTTEPLTVNFDVGGTATFNTDYAVTGATSINETTGSVTFLAGQASKTVVIDPTGDTLVESNETVILTLATGIDYVVATPLAATATITNDDTEVSVTVSPSSVNENGTPNLIYTFTRIGVTTNSLTVNFTVGGTATFANDYSQTGSASFNATTGRISFSSGQTTKTITINPTGDAVVESDETVILTIVPGTTYTAGTANSIIATILNDDGLLDELP